MKQKEFFKKEVKKIFKKELKINVKENNKIYDFVQWDSLGNFNVLLSCEKIVWSCCPWTSTTNVISPLLRAGY